VIKPPKPEVSFSDTFDTLEGDEKKVFRCIITEFAKSMNFDLKLGLEKSIEVILKFLDEGFLQINYIEEEDRFELFKWNPIKGIYVQDFEEYEDVEEITDFLFPLESEDEDDF